VKRPNNDIDGLALALALAITAPTDKQSRDALAMANGIAAGMSAEAVDTAKARAEAMVAGGVL
jgi:hypothetical protein